MNKTAMTKTTNRRHALHNANKLIAAVLAAVFSTFVCAAAQAQTSFRTFVSGTGSDTGACGVAAPCRSFAYALGETSAGGEIVVLSSAGYGPVTINQAVTITNPGGVEAGITGPSGGNAITITATSGAVTLRGLTLAGGGSATNGIVLSSSLPAANAVELTVNILGCVIKDFTGDGILLEPTYPGGATPSVNAVIADCTITGNGTGIATNSGVNISLSSSIYRTIVSSNGTGMNLSTAGAGYLGASLMSSHVDNNTSHGIEIASNANLTMKHSSANSTVYGTDITNSNASLTLYDRNTIGSLSNSNIGYTDGTNNISNFNGTALTKNNLM